MSCSQWLVRHVVVDDGGPYKTASSLLSCKMEMCDVAEYAERMRGTVYTKMAPLKYTVSIV